MHFQWHSLHNITTQIFSDDFYLLVQLPVHHSFPFELYSVRR